MRIIINIISTLAAILVLIVAISACEEIFSSEDSTTITDVSCKEYCTLVDNCTRGKVLEDNCLRNCDNDILDDSDVDLLICIHIAQGVCDDFDTCIASTLSITSE